MAFKGYMFWSNRSNFQFQAYFFYVTYRFVVTIPVLFLFSWLYHFTPFYLQICYIFLVLLPTFGNTLKHKLIEYQSQNYIQST